MGITVMYWVETTQHTGESQNIMIEQDLLKIIIRLLKFPHATICRHYIMEHILQILITHKFPIANELVETIVIGNDEGALSILAKTNFLK